MILLVADDVIDFVYDHLDEVMLILKSADKTSLANWQDVICFFPACALLAWICTLIG